MSSNFSATVHQNQYLPKGASEVHAILTVNSATSTLINNMGGGAAKTNQQLVAGFLIDNSGSMRGIKMPAAREATCKAIELLPETAEFFVLKCSTGADVVVKLCKATKENKAAAIRAVRTIDVDGSTNMPAWLRIANGIFAQRPGCINIAILLTDGGCDKEAIPHLPAAVAECEGKFQCESRGFGDDFVPDQLRQISGKLLGTVDLVRDAAAIEADFQNIIEKSKGLAISDARIQLWMPQGAGLEYIKQVLPEIADLTGKRTDGPNPLTGRYPTGAWGEESRDYHICIKVTPGSVGQKMLAGRVALVVTENGVENKVAEAQVLAVWTDDEKLSAVINKQVANYTGQAELAEQIQAGLKAKEAGDEAGATKALGRALELAEQTGNEGTKKLLGKVVEREANGTVRLKKADKADVLDLDTKSVRTTRLGGGAAKS